MKCDRVRISYSLIVFRNRGVCMDPTTALQTVRAWPVEEQLEFLFRAWDQLVDGGWEPELTEELPD